MQVEHTASWVIREKSTKRVIFETFSQGVIDKLNTEKYESIPILEYLQSINGKQRTPDAVPDSSDFWREVAEKLGAQLSSLRLNLSRLPELIDQAKKRPWEVNADYWDGRTSAFEEVLNLMQSAIGGNKSKAEGRET